MLKQINKSLVKNLLPKRDPKSHKGDNGRVLILAGSKDYFGAPILSASGALRAGADLAYLFVPEVNFECSRGYFPDLIVRKYAGNYLHSGATDFLLEAGKKCQAVLIGPGLGEEEETIVAVLRLIKELNVPMVIDADGLLALKRVEKFPLMQPILVTPHQNEFRNMVDRDVIVKEDDAKSIILLRSLAMDLNINILLKGYKDFVASEEGHVEVNVTGNAGMTVGGTGDVLAGACAGLMAQGLHPFDAARVAAFYLGKAGDELKKKKGFGYLASEVAEKLCEVMW